MKTSIKLNAILNAIKQLLAVLFPLITVPYASRILQSANYGKINFSSSIVNYIVLIAALGISTYAIREGASIRKDKQRLSKFENEVFTINIYSTLIAYAVLAGLLVFCDFLKEYRLLMIIQSSAIIFTTLGADWINSIHEDFLYITIRYIIIQILSIICLFLFVKEADDYIIYAMVSTFSSVGGNIFNILYIRKKYTHLRLVKNCNLGVHFKPIMILFFNAIAVTIYVNSDTTILGFFKGDEAVGIYGIAAKLYTVIKQVLNAVIGGIALPRFSAYLGQKKLYEFNSLLKKVLEAQIVLLFPCIVGLFMLSREIIMLVAGEGYILGSTALRILSLALGFAVFACFYCNCILLPNRKEKICLSASIISAVVNIVLNFFLIPLLSYDGAALTTLIAEATVFIIYCYQSSKLQKSEWSNKNIISPIIGCVCIAIICMFVKKIFINYLIVLFVAIPSSICVYALVLVCFKNELVMQLIRNVRRKL